VPYVKIQFFAEFTARFCDTWFPKWFQW